MPVCNVALAATVLLDANEELSVTFPEGVPEAVLATRTYTGVDATVPDELAKVKLVAYPEPAVKEISKPVGAATEMSPLKLTPETEKL